MNLELDVNLARRAAVYSALGDPARLRIADILSVSDASPSELAVALEMPSNLLAHHLKVLREVGLVASHRSQGDGRRQYLPLADRTLGPKAPSTLATSNRVVFVCTANSARLPISSRAARPSRTGSSAMKHEAPGRGRPGHPRAVRQVGLLPRRTRGPRLARRSTRDCRGRLHALT